MYNLPPGADHAAFIKWRTTEHQKDNMSLEGVIKSDFYIIRNAWQRDQTPYCYMTEAYFPDMETFEKTFFNPDYQVKLTESCKRITEPLFLISEEVLSEIA
jgi:hypothetical protein